jgi:hypothetical protein
MNEQTPSPANEPEPVEGTGQAKTDEGQQQPHETTALAFVQADDGDAKQPDAAARGDEPEDQETDRRQDKAISSLAEQIDWIEQQTKWIKYQVIASAFLGVVTLGVLVYHGVIMGKQSRVMESQNQIMTESLKTTERAYVAVYSIETDLRLGTATILLENKGRLPAKNIRVNTVQYLWLGKHENAAIEDRKTFDWGKRGELFPGNYKIPIVLLLDPRIQVPENGCIIGGYLMYDDGFGREVESAFAFTYYPEPLNQWGMVSIGDPQQPERPKQ